MRDEVFVYETSSSDKRTANNLVLEFVYGDIETKMYSLIELQQIYQHYGNEVIKVSIDGRWVNVDEDELEKFFELSMEELDEYFRNKKAPRRHLIQEENKNFAMHINRASGRLSFSVDNLPEFNELITLAKKQTDDLNKTLAKLSLFDLEIDLSVKS